MIYLVMELHENWVFDRHVKCVGKRVSWGTLGDIHIYLYA